MVQWEWKSHTLTLAQWGNFGECFLGVVVPAWSAGTQVHMDVSRSILRTRWMPAVHAGMTDAMP